MKPSKIIEERFQIIRGFGTRDDTENLERYTKAVIEYLDEEKERVNEILHEIVTALHDGSFDIQNCNYLHQMIDEKLVDPEEGK